MTDKDTSGYNRISLPDADRPEGYRQDYGNRPNQRSSSAERVSGKIIVPEAKGAYHGFRVVSKVESKSGLYWDVTYEAHDGTLHTVQKLKATREGHG
jgi:hypothetical protein